MFKKKGVKMTKNYYQTHKEELKAKMKKYQQTHKEQHNQTCKKYRENNKQKVAESNKKWREKNQERFKANNEKFYQNNPDYNKNYYLTHKEELLAKQKQYREEHLSTKKEYNQQYYQQNKEKAKQNAKKWREQNKDKRKESNAKWYQKQKEMKLKKKMTPFNEMAEVFKHAPIKGYEKDYQAFENGSIWSWKQSKFKNQRKGKDGYYKVGLMIDKKKSIDYMVSRLIASAFDDRTFEELERMECHHLNMKQYDNSIQNLIFLSKKDHQFLHNNFTDEQIKDIGKKVVDLRGTDKTNMFIRIMNHIINKK